jgi:hypothetical protein
MRRVSRYELENDKIYKLRNKRLKQLIIFKILSDKIREKGINEVYIDETTIYLRLDDNIRYRYKESSPTDLHLFKNDIIYELSETELLIEIL